jgi:hypothetical protein
MNENDDNRADPRAPDGAMSRPGNRNGNDNTEGEEDTRGCEKGTGHGKGPSDEKVKGKATDDGKGKGNGKGKSMAEGKGQGNRNRNRKEKGIVKQTPGRRRYLLYRWLAVAEGSIYGRLRHNGLTGAGIFIAGNITCLGNFHA